MTCFCICARMILADQIFMPLLSVCLIKLLLRVVIYEWRLDYKRAALGCDADAR